MLPLHSSLIAFNALEDFLQLPVAFLSELTPDRRKFYEWVPWPGIRQVLYQSIKSCDMALELIRHPGPRLVFIHEHKSQYAIPLYVVCLLRGVPVFFLVHGLQQTSSRSFAHYAGLHILRGLVRSSFFWPLHLERGDETLPPGIRFSRSIRVPHPLSGFSGRVRRPREGRKLRVGVVGLLRGDKPVLPLVSVLKAFCDGRDDYELVLGTPFWQITEEVKALGVSIVDTSEDAQYQEVLESIDILAAIFDRESFYFRPSGVINDAVNAGCYVVAPDYLVFEAQLTVPCRVGRTFAELSGIGEALIHAAADLRSGAVDFDAWRKYRETGRIVADLGGKIRQALDYEAGNPC
jgi:hypothetical protein